MMTLQAAKNLAGTARTLGISKHGGTLLIVPGHKSLKEVQELQDEESLRVYGPIIAIIWEG